MTDLAGERVARAPVSGRATALAALQGALAGIALSGTERRFLARISHWDKRSAGMVAALLARARDAGRREAARPADLDPAQRGVLLAALMDACAYRMSGSAAADCWECAGSVRCAQHAQDAHRTREFAELAAELSDGISQVALARLHRERAHVTIAHAG